MAGQIKTRCEDAGRVQATVRSSCARRFYRIGNDAVATLSILPIIRAHTLNRDAEQSADVVELLCVAGLGQAEVRSIRGVDVVLEGGARLQMDGYYHFPRRAVHTMP